MTRSSAAACITGSPTRRRSARSRSSGAESAARPAIDWLAALELLGIERLDADSIERTLGSVLKYDEDQDVIRAAGLEQLVTGRG